TPDDHTSTTNASKTVAQKPAPAGQRDLAGLPLKPGRDSSKALDPEKVAAQAQNLSMPAKIALPALLANSKVQERTLAELNDRPERQGAAASARRNPIPDEAYSIVPAP